MNRNRRDHRGNTSAAESETNQAIAMPVAIIGIGCRFPGGINSPESFWQLLCDGVDAITDVPADRFDMDALYDSKPGTPGKIVSRQGGFLRHIDRFDATFFGISPREATYIDPQQRLLLEVTWEALEDAGQPAEKIVGSRTGVFVGSWTSDYEALMFGANSEIDLYMTTGGGRYSLAGRLSYVFDLQGPSLTIDTACSSSLVAVHMACQSLRCRESDLALAGGANLILIPQITIGYSRSGMLSPSGRCRFGDARANGYVRSEGVGVVVLKLLHQALADGDPIYAVVLGSAVNNDGRAGGLLVAPGQQTQERVLRDACASAGVLPADLDYVEAHGTGTPTGDPIEIQALGVALGEGRPSDRPCLIGSVKTNIGHTEASSGIAGLTKAALCLKHRKIPASLHFIEPSRKIPWGDLLLKVQTELRPLRPVSKLALAGVNSFGITGTNAHVVLGEAPLARDIVQGSEKSAEGLENESSRVNLLPVSARSERALKELAGTYAKTLKEGAATIEDVCYSASCRRTHHDVRIAVVGRTGRELAERLQVYERGETAPGLFSGSKPQKREPGLALVFSGQGPQWAGMGRGLMESEPAFRETIQRIDAMLGTLAGWSVIDELKVEEKKSRLNQTEIAQPALFTIQAGLAELLKSWGVQPDAVVGHSVGEVAAAYIAGALSLKDAVRVIYHRGRLMQRATGRGKMAAMELSEAGARELIAPFGARLSIAAINGPKFLTLSGEDEALQEVLEQVRARKLFCRLLEVDYAFHSAQMEPYRQELVQALEGIHVKRPHLPLYSTVRGGLAREGDYEPVYWGRNMREPVRFASAVEAMAEAGCAYFVELSPHPVLSFSIDQCLGDRETETAVLATLRRNGDEAMAMRGVLAALYAKGRVLDWTRINPKGGRFVQLPAYPWQRERYWIENAKPSRRAGNFSQNDVLRMVSHPLLGQRLAGPLNAFETQLSIDTLALLEEQRAYGLAVVPGAVYLEMALGAAVEAFGQGAHTLKGMVIHEPIVLPEDHRRTVQVILTPEGAERASIQFYSLVEDEGNAQASWRLHATGKIYLGKRDAKADDSSQGKIALAEVQARCSEESIDTYAQRLRGRGVQLGEGFRGIDKLWRRDGEVLSEIRLPESLTSEASSYQIHPALLDACFRFLGGEMLGNGEQITAADTPLTISLESFRVYGRITPRLWSHALIRQREELSNERLEADWRLRDESGQVVAEALGLRFQPLDREVFLRATQKRWRDWLYEVQWQPKARLGHDRTSSPADYIPNPHQIDERVQSEVTRLSAEHGLDSYKALLPRLDALSAAYVLRAFRQLGWELRLRERVSLTSLAERLRVTDDHRRPLRRMLDMLEEEGVLRRTGTEWEVCQVPVLTDPQLLWTALLEQYPAFKAELMLIGRCGPRLEEVLRGDADPLDLLFPGGSLTELEKLYQDSPVARTYNSLVREVVARAVERLPVGRTGRILEIGAGTGGTTTYVLAGVPTDRTEYFFTDVSQLFLSKAEQKYRNYDFVRYQILDIERDPLEQGFSSHQFDVILAADVLHATCDLRRTLRNIQRILAPEGLLVLLELTEPQRWVDITFGLTDGWWRFTDTDIRPSRPLLSRREWLDLTEEVGFTEAVAISEGKDREGGLPQRALIVARGPRIEQEAEHEQAVFPAPEKQGSWMIIGDKGGVGHELAELIEARGERCMLVSAGDAFEVVDDGHLRIDPEHPEYFQQLFRDDLRHGWPPLRGVVHLLGLDSALSEETTVTELAAAVRIGCRSALYLLQAIIKAELNEPPRLWLVTRSAQSAGPDAVPLEVAQAPLWGLGRTVAMEHPEMWGGLVDLERGNPDDAASALLAEIRDSDGEDQIAFRAKQRYVGRLVRSKGHEALTESLPLRSDGSYLITGGLGGMGLKVARWLVEHGARHLVLVGRSGASRAASEAVGDLNKLGAQVIAAQADVSKEGDVARVLEEIDQSMPPLRGIIHAAGVFDDRVLVRHDWDRFANVFAPKVSGGWILHTLTRHMSLDFFVLFSSGASFLGARGLANYAAANAFLDALAHHRRAKGLPALSIDWGPWAKVGMAAAVGSKRESQWTQAGFGTMSADQGLEVLEHLLQQAPPQVGVLPVEWPKFFQQFPRSREQPLLCELAHEARSTSENNQSATSRLLQQFDEASSDHRRGILESYLRERIAHILNIEEEIASDTNFFELGLDSLMMMELANCVKQDLELTLYAREILEHPSIDDLATYLTAELDLLQRQSRASLRSVKSDTEPIAIRNHSEKKPASPPTEKNPGIIFLLSAPRSGSTLLRVMLAGHPALFCPPELHLLPFSNMKERTEVLGQSYLGEGLQRAFMELQGLEADTSKALVESLTKQDVSIQKVYRMLQESAGERLLVDKSPTYAEDIQILERAELLFEKPKYVHLVRHPYAMIESFVRMRVDRVMGTKAEDAFALAEQTWTTANSNILDFSQSLDSERRYRIYYEDLVRKPAEVMRGLCIFLNIPFDEVVLKPYEGNRMTDGVHAKSLSIGDPNFLNHDKIESELGGAWKNINLPRRLGGFARRVAAELQYGLPREAEVPAMPEEREEIII